MPKRAGLTLMLGAAVVLVIFSIPLALSIAFEGCKGSMAK